MRKTMGFVGMLGCILATASTSHAALVARWTFNGGDSGDLTGDIGGYTFAETVVGSSAGTTYNGDGTLSIGAGKLLTASGINSTDLPALTSNATVWMRVRFDGNPAQNFTAFGGFTQNAGGGSGAFAGLTMAAVSVNSVSPYQIGYTAETSTPTRFGPGSGFPTMAAGSFSDIALVYTAPVSPATQSTVTLYVNGAAVTRTATGPSLNSFINLALGRLEVPRGVALSFDEVRVYDESLTQSEVAAITPVPVPEPASVGLMLIGLGLMGLRR